MSETLDTKQNIERINKRFSTLIDKTKELALLAKEATNKEDCARLLRFAEEATHHLEIYFSQIADYVEKETETVLKELNILKEAAQNG